LELSQKKPPPANLFTNNEDKQEQNEEDADEEDADEDDADEKMMLMRR